MSRATRLRLGTLAIIVAMIYLLVRFGVGLYTDYLWFQQLALESVFLTGLGAKVWIGLTGAVLVAAFFLVNTLVARRLSLRTLVFFREETLVGQRIVLWGIGGASLLLAWLVGISASNSWLLFLRYIHQQPFNLADPIFNRDVGFYIFSLPLYHFMEVWVMVVLFASLIGTAAVYALAQYNNLAEGRLVILPHVQLHLSILGALIFVALAWGSWLDFFDLVYSPRGVAFGASYTDIHLGLPVLWTMIVLAMAAAIALLLHPLLRRPIFSLGTVLIWLVVSVVGTGFAPQLFQRYVVEPNELALETPYIQHNIRFTTLAYGLDRIEERDFAGLGPLTQQGALEHETTLHNIRLWDYRPLLQTYQQIQAIRLYYSFLDIDLDRYVINGEVRQVALAGRELEKSRLQSPTWVTQKLQFTHGYGLVVNPVNEMTPEGLPQLWVGDIPPQSQVDLPVERPEIYYGEATGDYVFVKTQEREFDYPSGDENVYTRYQGTGGVVLDSLFKRLAFALRLADANMLLSQDFTTSSRVMLYRQIGERVRQAAPFLSYDRDPYLVVSPDGRLYWLQDAYTTSDRFPYAEPSDQINYIRNSVKVLIDAYHGSLTFYVVDPTDPLLSTYAAIFPRLFTPMEQMPDWLRAHLRYPEDLFRLQANLYQTYHMRDVNVFYNKEDLWRVPLETLEGNAQPMEPYYVVLKLPGLSEAEEFVIIQAFTPNNKDNLIAWLAGRADGEHYGRLVAYRFPKQELVFGPLQVEGRIDQHPEISAQISLWDRGGSEVIRGNLLVLPVGASLLYVEPLYLRAASGQIPELKRIILVSGDRIVMEETLAAGLRALFSHPGPVQTGVITPVLNGATSTAAPTPEDEAGATDQLSLNARMGELAITASRHYEAAQLALQNKDLATYGEEMEQVKAALEAMLELTGGK